MTNEEEEKLSPEEQRALIVKKTLEDTLYQEITGGNEVKNNPFLYGQLALQGAEQTYRNAEFSDGFRKIEKEIYDDRLKQKKALGIFEDPVVTHYDVVARIISSLREVQQKAKLSELEKYAKSTGAEINFEIPKDLQNYSVADVVEKMQKEKREKPTEQEQVVISFSRLISEAYVRACALNAFKTNYYSDINIAGKEMAEGYNSRIGSKK